MAAFENSSFENAAADGTAGEADGWTWTSTQSAVEWAEFNTSDVLAYRGGRESFEGGWSGNEDAVTDLADATIAAALFDVVAELHAATIETFNIWTDFGTPWMDSYELTAAVFQSWVDQRDGGTANGQTVDSFDETWNTNPFYSSAADWLGNGVRNGSIYSSALTFPLEIEPNKNDLLVYNEEENKVLILQLDSGEYATAAALAAMIETKWASVVGSSNTQWDDWTNGDETGIRFGNKGTGIETIAALGVLPGYESSDVRNVIGLGALGPGGSHSYVELPVSELSEVIDGHRFVEMVFIDAWSFVSFSIVTDGVIGAMLCDYKMTPGVFNTSTGSADTRLDNFGLDEWFGVGAVWDGELTAGELTAASFVGGSGGGTIEDFENPATNWPDHLWT